MKNTYSLIFLSVAAASVALGQACSSSNTVRSDGSIVGASGAGPGNMGTGTGGASTGPNILDLTQGETGNAASGAGNCGAASCMERVPACGDSVLDAGEKCDDGNGMSRDGCGANCDAVEKDFACPTPGMPCVTTVACGDSKITGSETCDDGNAAPGDGCSAACALEAGWGCPVIGVRCGAALCGDSRIAGAEDCDDGNSAAADGCSATCTLEPGFKCDTLGQPCSATSCGDGQAEGTEQCDDGNFNLGDGCSTLCKFEPKCANGVCEARCGDGIKLESEACDDGNQRNFDGCSSTCTIETGFSCEVLPDAPIVPVVYRDFVGTQKNTPVDTGLKHPDFQNFYDQKTNPTGVTRHDCQQSIATILDAASKPSLVSANNCVKDAASFAQWYRSDNAINRTVVDTMTLTATGTPGAYEFFDNSFFPLTGRGFNDPNALLEHTRPTYPSGADNFSFTTELRYWFTYRGGERLTFYGDDDLWVFINGHRAVNIPGLHFSQTRWIQLGTASTGSTGGDPPTEGIFDEAALGLTPGGVYEVAIFNAERQTGTSYFKLTLQNFLNAHSVCKSTCGDGIVASNEACDDAKNDGSYGSCNPDCSLGPRCGDGVFQAASGEVCDNGINLTSHAPIADTTACAPGCKKPNFCGDSIVDGLFGEACDNGVNDGGYGQCAAECRLGEYCGDGIRNGPEQCDDGNKAANDGCTPGCTTGLR